MIIKMVTTKILGRGNWIRVPASSAWATKEFLTLHSTSDNQPKTAKCVLFMRNGRDESFGVLRDACQFTVQCGPACLIVPV